MQDYQKVNKMKLENKIKLIPRELKSDERGWFLKIINGEEGNISFHEGEVYLTMAYPGQVRGNHYHFETNEWFTVVQGVARVLAIDPVSKEEMEWILDGKEPVSLYIPAGVAHAFLNISQNQDTMLLAAYADRLYDPKDTVNYSVL